MHYIFEEKSYREKMRDPIYQFISQEPVTTVAGRGSESEAGNAIQVSQKGGRDPVGRAITTSSHVLR